MLEKLVGRKRDQMTSQLLCVTCPGAPDNRTARLVRPLGREALLKTAREIRWDCEAQCLLLDLPDGERRMAVMQLEDWAEEMEPHAQKVVACHVPGAPFACGAQAKCQQHTPTLERDAIIAFNQLLGRAKSVAEAVNQAFKGLKARDQRIVTRWATEPDPELKMRPIRLKFIAAGVKLSERQIKNILAKARDLNPRIYARLEQIRADRAHITHGKPITPYNP